MGSALVTFIATPARADEENLVVSTAQPLEGSVLPATIRISQAQIMQLQASSLADIRHYLPGIMVN